MKCSLCCALLLAVSAAVALAQEPDVCAGDCAAARDHVASAAAAIDRDKNAFVGAVRQLIQAVPGRDLDAPSRVAASVEEMARALGRWDRSLRTYRAVVLDAAGQSADAHVSLAAAYLERGDGQAALKEARGASAIDPTRPDAWILQALACDLARRPADAAQALGKAAKLGAGRAAATYGLAQRLIEVGDEAGASAALRAFDAAQPDPPAASDARRSPTPFVRAGLLRQQAGVAPLFPPAGYIRGFVLLMDGAFEQAVEELRTAASRDVLRVRDLVSDEDIRQGTAALGRADLRVAIDRLRTAVERWPARAEARQLLGLAFQADEQYARSVEEFSVAVQLNAADDIGRSALADALVLAGRSGDAEHALRAGIDVSPDSSGGLSYQLALLYQSMGRNADAIRELERATRQPPVVGQDHLYDLLGVLYTSDANLDGALAAYRRRVLVNPNNSEGHRKLGQIYLEQSRADAAAAEFTAALLLDPSNAEACEGRAQVDLRLNDYAGAAKWARRAIVLARTHVAARYTLGTALVRLGQVEEGTAALEEFRRLQEAAQAAADRDWELKLLKQSAQTSLDAGDLEAAVASLRRVAAREPDVAANHVNLGLVLERAGRADAAIDAYRTALELSADANVHGHLAAAYAALGREQESQAEQALYERSKEERLRSRGFAR